MILLFDTVSSMNVSFNIKILPLQYRLQFTCSASSKLYSVKLYKYDLIFIDVRLSFEIFYYFKEALMHLQSVSLLEHLLNKRIIHL